MKKRTKELLTAVFALALIFSLAACGASAPPATPSPQPSQGGGTEEPAELPGAGNGILYADFANGRAEEDVRTSEWQFDAAGEDEAIMALAAGLSEWTGLDFTLAGVQVEDGAAKVDWAAESTLVAGLDEREQREDFYFFDAASLNWFMMDSLARTIKENLPVDTVYYSMDGGKELTFLNPEDMAAQGLPSLPPDQSYEGSAFFAAHAGGEGGEEED
ncbi:MAG: hypothetical protein LBH21_06700 [Gracilibacteraceae bacterium]|jgi:hypothetical protein|nr:hypothetical protein [Gracilibacteraceae bacterium]